MNLGWLVEPEGLAEPLSATRPSTKCGGEPLVEGALSTVFRRSVEVLRGYLPPRNDKPNTRSVYETRVFIAQPDNSQCQSLDPANQADANSVCRKLGSLAPELPPSNG